MAFPFDIRAARYSGTRLQTLRTPARCQQYSKSSPPGGTARTASRDAATLMYTAYRERDCIPLRPLTFISPLLTGLYLFFFSHNEPRRSELSVEVCAVSTQGGWGCSERRAYSITGRERVRGREKKEWANINERRVALWSPSLPPYSGTVHRQTADASHAAVRGAPHPTLPPPTRPPPLHALQQQGTLTFGPLKIAPPAPRQRRDKNDIPPR